MLMSAIPGCTLEQVLTALPAMFDRMYAGGWTVIGSQLKTPRLHPWKDVPRAQMYQLAHSNFACYRANSINIRLSDTDTIALDCDFHDPWLMRSFLSRLQWYLGLSEAELWTCTGGKGGKVFFSMPRLKGAAAPRKLGCTAYDRAAPAGYQKNEMELKTDLSTVAGIHSLIFNPAGQLQDCIVYGPIPGTSYIADAAPGMLPTITRRELSGVESILNNLMASKAASCSCAPYTDAEGKPLHFGGHDGLIISAVAFYLRQYHLNLDSMGKLEGDFAPPEGVLTIHGRVMWMLGLTPAIDCIRHIVHGHPLGNERLQDLCIRARLSLAGILPEELEGRAALYLQHCSWHSSILMERIRRRPDLQTPDTTDLETLCCDCLAKHRSPNLDFSNTSAPTDI